MRPDKPYSFEGTLVVVIRRCCCEPFAVDRKMSSCIFFLQFYCAYLFSPFWVDCFQVSMFISTTYVKSWSRRFENIVMLS
jgi:hypothetical protein